MNKGLFNNQAKVIKDSALSHSLETADFDEITRLAAIICETPFALVSFFDNNQQWIQSKFGWQKLSTPNDFPFCTQTRLQRKLFIVPDAKADDRFATHSIVTNAPNLRFYAGIPLISSDEVIGTLCVMDRVPRHLSSEQLDSLQILGQQIIKQIKLEQDLSNSISTSNHYQSTKKLLPSPIAIAVLLLSLNVTLIAWDFTKKTVDRDIKSRTERQVNEATKAVKYRIKTYVDGLRNAQGLFAASVSVERSEWKAFVDSINLQQHYPGINGLGFIRYVPSAKKLEYEQQVRKETSKDKKNYPNFAIKPAGNRQEYFVIEYIEPIKSNRLAFGLDIGFEEKRRKAALDARDTGEPAITGSIILVQDLERKPGFLILLPVYRSGKTHATVAQRRKNLVGFVYAPFKIFNLIKETLPNHNQDFDLKIYDRSDLIYDGDSARLAKNAENLAVTQNSTLSIAGREWNLYFNIHNIEQTSAKLPLVILSSGTLISLLLFGITWSLSSSRGHALYLATKMTAAMRQSEERYRRLVELSPEMIAVHSEGKLVYINAAGIKIFGAANLDDLIGKSILDVVHPDSLERIEERDCILEEQGKAELTEIKLIRLDGKVIDVETIAIRIVYQGKLAVQEIVRDISDRKQAEAALRESERQLRISEERLNLALDSTEDGLWDWNITTGDCYFSPRWLEMLGYRLGDLQMHISTWEALLHPEDLVQMFANLQAHLNEQIPIFELELRLQHKSGDWCWILNRGKVVARDPQGQPLRMVGTIIEISDRKGAETALRESEARLRLALEAADMGTWDWNLLTNEFIYSDRLGSIFGLHEGISDPTYNAFLNFVHPDDRNYVNQALIRAIEEGIDYKVEFRVIWPDGSQHWLNNQGQVYFDKSGQPSRMIGVTRDITTRKQAQEEIQKQFHSALLLKQITQEIRQSLDTNQIFKTTVIQIGQAFKVNRCVIHTYVKSPVPKIPLVAEYLEAGHESILNLAVPITDNPHMEQLLLEDRAIASDNVYTEPLLANSSHLCAEINVKSMLSIRTSYQGEPNGVIGLHHCDCFRHWREDEIELLTAVAVQVGIAIAQANLLEQEQQRRQELTINNLALEQARKEAEAASRAKSDFLAVMSHEIRTPMNGIIGMSGLLLKTSLNQTQQEFTQAIRSSADNLLTIINEILDFSKLEAGKVELEVLDFDLTSCLDDITDLLAFQASQKSIELIIFIHKNVPNKLQGDVGRLRQILINLVGNAIKFTSSGEVAIEVALQSETATTASLLFSVTDTGIGIAIEDQKKLFQSFSQVDASTTRKYGGTGLGLAISKELVAMMSGEIGVESSLGQGSKFWFTANFQKQIPPQHQEFKRLDSYLFHISILYLRYLGMLSRTGQWESFKRLFMTLRIAILPPSVRSHLTPYPSYYLQGCKVLIVDDNATNRKVLRDRATNWGMEVTEVDNANTALIALQNAVDADRPYDIAIIDMQMPEIDGEILSQIIKADLKLAATKLIMLTSISEQNVTEKTIEKGFSGYLIKPVKEARLFECLLNVFRAKDGDNLIGKDKNQTTNNVAISENQLKHRSHLKILLAEDNIINQKVALNQLRILGYEADCVANGQEALDILNQINYDIILMDCQMPVLDGYDTTQEIRRQEGSLRHTVIIAMTANALKEDRAKCLAAGMDDYISKPVALEDLEAIIERWYPQSDRILSVEEEPKTEHNLATSLPELPNMAIDTAIDIHRLHHISAKDPEFEREILTAFVDEATTNLQAIKMAIRSNDFLAIEHRAHQLKGGSANLGAASMQELAAELEILACKQNLSGATELLAKLEKKLQDVQVFVAKYN